MRRTFLTSLVLVGLFALPAQAQTITKVGSNYSGIANPGGCKIFVHDDLPDVLHVNCKDATAPARIRYRFLRDVGGQFGEADVSVDWEKRGEGGAASVRWMVPTPRTLRVVVRGYVHINSVTWTQPPA